jgi:Caspase domain
VKRRDFLVGGIFTAAAIAAPRFAVAQNQSQRGAVVIGVNKTGNLPILNAARSGAKQVSDWLNREGFEVKPFVDETGPVEAHRIFEAIKNFVDRGTLDQLVVYFAGHGCISGTTSELWLLSGAPDDPNAAVVLNECYSFAQTSGIPNVVFISDACRSRADTLGAWGMKGQVIFPNRRANQKTQVDQFLATRAGAAAYEYEQTVAQSTAAFRAIYTDCFLDAFKNPYPDMVIKVGRDEVVPNRRLQGYLDAEVPKRARAVRITLEQRPDSQVNSQDQTYIGRVSRPAPSPSTTGTPGVSATPTLSPRPPSITPNVSDVAKSALTKSGLNIGPAAGSNDALASAARLTGFQSALETIVVARGFPSEFLGRTGFTVSGERVISAVAHPGVEVNVTNHDSVAFVDVGLRDNPAASVTLQFANGSGTIIAALDRYVGNVVVAKGKVTNVSYIPSRENELRGDYEHQGAQLEQLHAAVATAARFGVFRIEGSKKDRNAAAEKVADRIRIMKSVDPTLGLYAAYAYAQAGLPDQIRSVRNFMRGSLRVDLFDVAMLAGVMDSLGTRESPVPCCPMLSQGWDQFRVKGIRISETVETLRDHLKVSLWTTFDEEGGRIAERWVGSGRVR